MSLLQTISHEAAISDSWREEGGVFWHQGPTPDVRTVALAMNGVRARFVTITAYQLPKDEGFRLEYHWDLNGRLLGFVFILTGNSIESIYDLCEAADWIEREVHEGFGIDFTGRKYEPLLLRPGDAPGVNTREGAAPVKPAVGLTKCEGIVQ